LHGAKTVKSLASDKVLAETKGRLLSLSDNDRALWGKMTATQMVRHLWYAYEVALGDRSFEGPLKGPLPPKAMKLVALRSGLKWPKNVPTVPVLVRAVEEESKATFGECVGAAVRQMETLAAGTRCADRHPTFGPMSLGDWMRWGYLHADHHLRQFGR
jgi:hypothetical protein